MSETIRSFIAFELPENIISSIGKLQKQIKCHGLDARWVRPENIHLTLKFLGDITKTDMESAGGTIIETAKGYAPIFLSAKGIGIFPNIKRPRVIWAGIAGQISTLVGLQRELDENLESIGFAKEKRLFKGHLTLGRIKKKIPLKRLSDAIKKFEEFESEIFTADQIILFKSVLKPSGHVYTKLLIANLTVSQKTKSLNSA